MKTLTRRIGLLLWKLKLVDANINTNPASFKSRRDVRMDSFGGYPHNKNTFENILFSNGLNTPTLASSFRRKSESIRWMPAYAGMTNTSPLARIFIFLLFVCCSVAEASFERTLQPAIVVGRGMSGITLLLPEYYSLNPASFSSVKNFRTSLFYSPSQFELPQLSGSGALAIEHFEFGNVGIAISTFGFSLYRETIGTINYSDVVGNNVSYGINVNVNHLSLERYGTAVALGIDIGASFKVVDDVRIACALLNINRPKFKNDEDLPQQFMVGASYTLFDLTTLTVDAVKDVRYPISLRGGIEISPHASFRVRAGISDSPSRLFGGVSVTYSVFRFDYGIATHQELGASHSIGLSFEL